MRVIRQHPWLSLGVAIAAAIAVYFGVSQSAVLIEAVGRLPAPAAILAGWVAIFPNEAKKLFGEAVGTVFYWSNRGQRIAVGAAIEADVARAESVIGKESPGLFPSPLRIRWYRGAAGAIDLPEGEVIVKLKDHRDRATNLTTIATARVRHSALHHSWPHLDPDVSKAVEFSIVNDVLEQVDRRIATAYRTDVCHPACAGSARLAELCDWVRVIDDHGLFTRVGVPELIELGSRLAGQLPSASAALESFEFLGYLHRIATKAPGEDLSDDLRFSREHFAVGVVLVARPAVYALHGETPYTNRVGSYAREGVGAVYLVARGTNVDYAKAVADQLRSHGNVTSLEEWDFDVKQRGWSRPAFVARVTINLKLSRRAERRFAVLRADGSRTRGSA